MIWVYPELLSIKLGWFVDQAETTTLQTILVKAWVYPGQLHQKS
jgi:hypothetical protein